MQLLTREQLTPDPVVYLSVDGKDGSDGDQTVDVG